MDLCDQKKIGRIMDGRIIFGGDIKWELRGRWFDAAAKPHSRHLQKNPCPLFAEN